MTRLQEHLRDYLALRRSLGYKLEQTGRVLGAFATFIERSHSSFITAELVAAWAGALPRASAPTVARRLASVRHLAEFVRMLDPRTEIPPRNDALGRARRPTPYIYSDDDIARLIATAATLRAKTALRKTTIATVIGLLSVTGMRVGEALKLDRSDFDRRDGALTIRGTKFGKSRRLPLSPTTRRALLAYECVRDRTLPRPKSPSFFLSDACMRIGRQSLGSVFARLRRRAGLLDRSPRPRIHDLRHSFAVRTLLDWYRAGVDVQARLPVLSTYLGHVSPASTYWYLTAIPELVALAGKRLERAMRRRP